MVRSYKSLVIVLFLFLAATSAHAQQKKPPNIVVIFGDDVGIWNISAYHRGMMGGRTPDIDRWLRHQRGQHVRPRLERGGRRVF